jgi:hypothetical protein
MREQIPVLPGLQRCVAHAACHSRIPRRSGRLTRLLIAPLRELDNGELLQYYWDISPPILSCRERAWRQNLYLSQYEER